MSAALAALRHPTRKQRRVVARALAEDREEHLAPAIQRTDVKDGDRVIRPARVVKVRWDDPDDTNTRSKTARQVLAYRRGDPLLWLHSRNAGLAKHHLDAANKYRDDFDVGVQGARIGYERPESGSGASPSSVAPSAAQLIALDSHRQATEAVSPGLRWVLQDVVIDRLRLADVSEKRGQPARNMPGLVIGVLETLAAHYEEVGDKPRRRRIVAAKNRA